ITIDAFNEQGNVIAKGNLTIERTALKSYFYSGSKTSVPVFEEFPYKGEPDIVKPTNSDKSVGYMLFSRSPLDYVFSESRPKESEIIDHVSITVVRNEFEPVTFSLYPLRNLGKVTISISNLKGTSSTISKDKIKIAYVENVQDSLGLQAGKFYSLPALIKPGNQVEVEEGKCQRFWLTIRINDNVLPGVYKGKITISPQNGREKSLPFQVNVMPISLEDIPGIDYFMLMTYEFTELTMPWKKEEKEKIYESAFKILKDYKEHGMTTLNPHSPFVLIRNDDGTPNLEDIFATLKAARDIGFTRPIVWYMGHLIQTAKPKHPGNIHGFDNDIHVPRLEYIVKTVSSFAKENGCPEVIFLPIDEPDDIYQDFQDKRRTITPLLLKKIQEAGAKSMLTTHTFNRFKPLNYICTSEVSKEGLKAAHSNGSIYWVYNNEVTTKCNNPAYARYIYGYYTWENNIDGMTSWTFQNTQNASGLPTKADSSGSDIYLAYPDPHGPLATLKWEAIREGIDDHKLIYQLQKRITTLQRKGIDTSHYEKFLREIRGTQDVPGCSFEAHDRWNSLIFEQQRNNLISMILDAETKIGQGQYKTKTH
ncbi:MAG: DUF6067 family protein, partial [Nitrospirota bacterium]|nr:DUF6067 family protein [Nitrospirota bacterium]